MGAESRFQFVNQIKFFPSKELHILEDVFAFAEGVAVFVIDLHFVGFGLATEMPVRCRFLENRVGETETLHDKVGS